MGNRGKTTEYAEGQRFVEMDSMDRMQRMDGGSAKGGIGGVRSFCVVDLRVGHPEVNRNRRLDRSAYGSSLRRGFETFIRSRAE